VTLWQLLIGVCFATTVGGAVGSARAVNAAATGYGVAITIVVAIGTVFSWAMWKRPKAVVPRVLRLDERDPISDWCFRAFYASTFIWIAFALLVGSWLSSLAVRLVT
jgi:hypothetical protein